MSKLTKVDQPKEMTLTAEQLRLITIYRELPGRAQAMRPAECRTE